MSKFPSALRKKPKKKGLSFQSLLRDPDVRRHLRKSPHESAKTKKTKFYESLILDTKPTDTENEKKVAADTPFYTTPQLSTVLNDPDFPKESLNFVGESMLNFKKTLLDVPPGEIRGVFLHTTLDDLMQEEDIRAKEQGEVLQVTCKKGCAHCCHKLVYITPDEGMLLARNLIKKEGGQISQQTMDILKFQASFQPHQQLDFWMLDEAKSKCVFLGPDKSCMIYLNRPANCRLLRVRSPAYNCSKVATMRGEGELDQNLTLMGEMLVSAAYDLTLTEKRSILSIPQAILTSLKDVNEDTTKETIEKLNEKYTKKGRYFDEKNE